MILGEESFTNTAAPSGSLCKGVNIDITADVPVEVVCEAGYMAEAACAVGKKTVGRSGR